MSKYYKAIKYVGKLANPNNTNYIVCLLLLIYCNGLNKMLHQDLKVIKKQLNVSVNEVNSKI